MKITVTPVCQHPDLQQRAGLGDGWKKFVERYRGKSTTGTHVIVSHHGVCLDGTWVIRRDRRKKSNREPGHPWLSGDTPYTGFTIDVDSAIK